MFFTHYLKYFLQIIQIMIYKLQILHNVHGNMSSCGLTLIFLSLYLYLLTQNLSKIFLTQNHDTTHTHHNGQMQPYGTRKTALMNPYGSAVRARRQRSVLRMFVNMFQNYVLRVFRHVVLRVRLTGVVVLRVRRTGVSNTRTGVSNTRKTYSRKASSRKTITNSRIKHP